MKKNAALREIREGNDDELKGRLGRLREELFGFRMKRYTNQLENTMKIRQTRREIARVETILANRKSGGEKQQAASAESAAQSKE